MITTKEALLCFNVVSFSGKLIFSGVLGGHSYASIKIAKCLFNFNDAFTQRFDSYTKYTFTNKSYDAVKGRTWTWQLFLLFIKRSTVIVHPAVTSSLFMSVNSDPARVSDMEDTPPCQKSCFPEFRVQTNAPQVSKDDRLRSMMACDWLNGGRRTSRAHLNISNVNWQTGGGKQKLLPAAHRTSSHCQVVFSGDNMAPPQTAGLSVSN